MNGSIGRWVGIDVAKSKLDVAMLDEYGKLKSHVFTNDAKGHAALMTWLMQRCGSQQHMRVCMEATGCYGEALAISLADAGWCVSVVNPARIKGFAQSELVRNKTDRADAALLARFGQALRPEPWVAPSLEVRQLRALVDRLHSLKEMHQQEANRLEAAMNQTGMRESIESHMKWLQADVRRFKNAKALAAFIGVTPRLKLSGSSVRGRSMISRSGHAAIRHALYMPALVALKHNPIVKTFGERLKNAGMAPKAVVAACMHKLVHLIYGILKSGTAFNANFVVVQLDSKDGI